MQEIRKPLEIGGSILINMVNGNTWLDDGGSTKYVFFQGKTEEFTTNSNESRDINEDWWRKNYYNDPAGC